MGSNPTVGVMSKTFWIVVKDVEGGRQYLACSERSEINYWSNWLTYASCYVRKADAHERAYFHGGHVLKRTITDTEV